jgi:adenylate kinase family enzyme
VQTYTSKLIVLRGNSGSGKSTVAKKLREASNRKIAIIEQDYLRRFILKEKETEGTNNIDLIEQIVEFALSRNYDVILEGILYFPRYGEMLKRLVSKCPHNYFFYFDVSFEETLNRHATKQNAHEFGETEMREWYKPNQLTHFKGEQVIPELSTIEETVNHILEVVRL